DKAPTRVRLEALVAIPDGPGDLPPNLFAFVADKLHRDQPVIERGLAARVLARAALSKPRLLDLTGRLKDAGPMELERVLDAFGRTTDEAVGLKLIAALKQAPARTSLRVDGLRTRLAKYGPKVKTALEALA